MATRGWDMHEAEKMRTACKILKPGLVVAVPAFKLPDSRNDKERSDMNEPRHKTATA